jgi:hypothetical protein
MKHPQFTLAMMAAAAGLLIAAPLANVRAQNTQNDGPNGPPVPIDPGFKPDTGQINPGEAPHPFSKSDEAIVKIPTPQEVRDAVKMQDFQQPSGGGGAAPQPAQAAPASDVTGTVTPPANGLTAPAPQASPGPIGSFGQTAPSLVSKRNALLDRVPTMALPLSISDQQREQIYKAIMAEKSEPVEGADALLPSSELTTDQVLNGMQALPASVSGIPELNGAKYLKAKNKVLLVNAASATVIDQIPY